MNQLKHDLIAAKALISDRHRWCQRAYEKDQEGFAIVATPDPNATQRCALGAVAAVTGEDMTAVKLGERFERCKAALDAAAPAVSPSCGYAAKVNDELGHAAVMEMYGIAIKAAE